MLKTLVCISLTNRKFSSFCGGDKRLSKRAVTPLKMRSSALASSIIFKLSITISKSYFCAQLSNRLTTIKVPYSCTIAATC